MIRLVTHGLYAVAASALGWGVYDALHEPPVYGPAAHYTIERAQDADGTDRIHIFAPIEKLRNCELETGGGPIWVDFYDADAGVPPPSSFFRPTGEQAGRTRAQAGETFVLDGYSAIVPEKMAGRAGVFVVNVPCQLYEIGPAGTRVYGRQVIATWGPAPVPFPRTTMTDKRPIAKLWSEN